MKFLASLSILAVCSVLLTGCPMTTSYPLGKKGEFKLNPDLLGVWVTYATDVEANSVEFTKGTEANTYNLTVLEKDLKFMTDGPKYIAWITKLKSTSFLVLQKVTDGVPEESYYAYHLSAKKKKATTHDILFPLTNSGADEIQSYRDGVQGLMKFDQFLSNRIDWVKK